MPIALHAAEAWWPGSTRDTSRGEVHNSCLIEIEAINRLLMSGIRTALTTWRTMPEAALRRKSGIPPAKVLLEERRLIAATRIRRLDDYHPLRLHALESTASARRRLGLRISDRGRQPATGNPNLRLQSTENFKIAT
ncbi:hypothetical protein K3495_g6086 [Podosphaera aphanis]|nr:hypothetical protein K3495_g6086 [Podosphaera aphanis]